MKSANLLRIFIAGVALLGLVVGYILGERFIFKRPQVSKAETSASPTPMLELVKGITDESPSPTPTVTTTPTPTPKPSQSPTPSSTPTPSPSTTMDLNLETVRLFPERINGVAAKEGTETNYKQDNKLKSIQLSIRNNGQDDAEKVLIKIIVDGETLSEFTLDRIEKQSLKQEKREGLNFPDKIGKHKIEVQVNPERKIAESKFDNNTKNLEYEYLP